MGFAVAGFPEERPAVNRESRDAIGGGGAEGPRGLIIGGQTAPVLISGGGAQRNSFSSRDATVNAERRKMNARFYAAGCPN